jgi:hypothetical protein
MSSHARVAGPPLVAMPVLSATSCSKAYYGAAAGDPSKGYYSVDVETWHLVALNGECQ